MANYRFRVPADLSPGVFRAGIGMYRPGDILTLPDSASVPGEVPSPKLIPLDEESRKWLQSRQEDAAKRRAKAQAEAEARKKQAEAGLLPDVPQVPPVEGAPPKEEPKADGRKSVRQLAKEAGAGT